jgi:uncharacterized protein
MIDVLVDAFADIGIIAVAATLIAGLMRGFAGFGSAMFMAPIFAVIFGSAEMVVTVVAMELGVSGQLFPAVRSTTQWRIIAPMSAAACLFLPLGLWLLLGIDRAIITKAVSIIVLGFVAIMLSGWHYRGEKGPVGASIVGALSGTMMATTSVGGPPVLLYLRSGRDPPEIGRANIIAYYFLTHIVLIALFLATGTVGGEALLRLPVSVHDRGGVDRRPTVRTRLARGIPARGARNTCRGRHLRPVALARPSAARPAAPARPARRPRTRRSRLPA